MICASKTDTLWGGYFILMMLVSTADFSMIKLGMEASIIVFFHGLQIIERRFFGIYFNLLGSQKLGWSRN